ncbi:hypothetical protein [Citreimonas salinaria]|uniref:NADH dehydrogenase n=1 Tax=Citreimonas salinaria TaxID=321339 RepID=A0A1H3GYQ6_9RHOB|nr:hypothetical protein [Citreimonas salinaria]SDY07664.1 hypothetical protein SAMN05444340_10389 [Citreimonas salinaria]
MGFLIWIAVTVATIIPLMKLLPHFGVHKYWAFAAVIPIVPLILLWVMALKLQDMERH